jgi:hypothetical protein
LADLSAYDGKRWIERSRCLESRAFPNAVQQSIGDISDMIPEHAFSNSSLKLLKSRSPPHKMHDVPSFGDE